MGAVGGLILRGRVPPRVGVDDHAGAGQVQPRVPGLQGDQEHRGVVGVERVDEFQPAFLRRGAGDRVIGHADRPQPFGDQVQIAGELGEDQHLAPRVAAALHQLLDRIELGRGRCRTALAVGRRVKLSHVLVDQSRIAAYLPQPGQLGEHLDPVVAEVHVAGLVDRGAQPLLQRRIQPALLPLQLHGDDVLDLVGQVLQHVGFQTSQDERPHERLQLGLRTLVAAQHRLLEPVSEMPV